MGTLVIAALIAASSAVPEAKTVEAVLGADERWLNAEMTGDTASLDQLLLPEYRSVSIDGKVTDKAKILDRVRRTGGSPDLAAKIAAWKAAHPLRGEVTIAGDTAVLRWVLVKPEAGDPVSSSDIFVYRDGHWRALYSQHSGAAN
jgi:hypothetical protein